MDGTVHRNGREVAQASDIDPVDGQAGTEFDFISDRPLLTEEYEMRLTEGGAFKFTVVSCPAHASGPTPGAMRTHTPHYAHALRG